MSVLTPASQILERHETHFENKCVLVAGDIHDNYPLQIDTAQTNIHCTQFHVYQELLRVNRTANIEFSVQPEASFYDNINSLIYYWPKNKTEAQFQLSYLLNALPKGADVFIVGENRSGVNSVEGLLADFGSIQKIDAARRCSLYYFQADSRLAFDFDEWWMNYSLQLADHDVTVYNLPGVFSQKILDAGSHLLLDSLLQHQHLVKGKVLDIGCGSGVLSLLAAKINPAITLTAADVNAMALCAAEKTFSYNNVEANIVASDVFSHIDGRFDLIISNPPFHDGKETDYKAVEKLISQSKAHLNLNGKICLVANTFLPYQQMLADNFKKVDLVAQTTKFKVYLASI